MKFDITPHPELVQQWLSQHFGTTVTGEVSAVELHIAIQAARWGYMECNAEYERAAMDIVPPTWLEDEEDNDD